MKKLLTLITIISALQFTATAEKYVPALENLQYKVMYKWGIISKQAGTVTVSTHDLDNEQFKSTLIGKSATWADKFFTVRDTLMGTIMTPSLEPVYYEKIAHEGGDFKRDVIIYDRSTPTVTGDCQRWRLKKKSTEVIHSTTSITGTGITLDMLSSFYYMRHIDYPDMEVGQKVTTNIFSGQKKEILNITFLGIQDVKINNQMRPCYYIKFTFTGDNGIKSSDDMFAWISTDSNRIPLKLQGNLPVGSIKCFYVP